MLGFSCLRADSRVRILLGQELSMRPSLCAVSPSPVRTAICPWMSRMAHSTGGWIGSLQDGWADCTFQYVEMRELICKKTQKAPQREIDLALKRRRGRMKDK